MGLYGIYHRDDQVDNVMGEVITRIDSLIERLGKGSKYTGPNTLYKKVDKSPENPSFVLPCEACAIRSSKRYSSVAIQTDEVIIHDEGVEELADDVINSPVGTPDDTPLFDAGSFNSSINSLPSSPEKQADIAPADTASADTDKAFCAQISDPSSSELSPSYETDNEEESVTTKVKTRSKIPTIKRSFSSLLIDKQKLDSAIEDDNASVLSSDDEYVMDLTQEEDTLEISEYKIAEKNRLQVGELGTMETVHFQMKPHRNLYVWGSRKYIGTLPSRIALKSSYNLNYHIAIFKNLSSDRADIRKKKLKELVTAKNNRTSSPRRAPASRGIDSSKLGNVIVVDVGRYARNTKKGKSDNRIPVVNLRDGYSNKLWLSERVSDILLSRSPRLRFAIELAKSNRGTWKSVVKDLSSNQRPYPYPTLYGGKSYLQFYISEMKRFVTKPLHSRCLVYYADIYEENTKDGVKSKSFVGCLGNQTSKDSRSTPILSFEDKLKEHLRLGQKLYDPKISIFNIALQNPSICLDNAGRMLPPKGSSEITKCPMLLFVPLDFGFSSWSRPTTQDHLSPLKQAYTDIFCSNGPGGYNI